MPICNSQDDESGHHADRSNKKVGKVAKLLFTPMVVWSLMNALVGLLGLIIHGYYSSSGGGAVFVINEFCGLWMSAVLLSFSFQLLYQTCKPAETKKESQKQESVDEKYCFCLPLEYENGCRLFWLILNLVYCAIMLVMTVMIFIGYSMYGLRVDLIMYSLLSVFLCLMNIVVVVLRWFSYNRMYPCNSCYEMSDNDSNKRTSSSLLSLNKNSTHSTQQFNIPKGLIIFCHWFGMILNIGLRLVTFIIVLLLVFGAVNLGGIVNIVRRGEMVMVQLQDGRTQKVHCICDGPKDSSPTFVFEGDFSHNYADYSDIQKYLASMGRRSCIYDKPGLGFSDYLYTDQKNASSFYHSFLKSIGERTPYVLVGWGGGGEIIYDYAREHPEMVQSLTFLDVFTDGIEFKAAKVLKNLSESEYLAYKKSLLNPRMNMMNIINGIAVPLGFLPFLIGSNSNTTNSNEIAFWMRTEKTWITQSVFLKEMMNNDYTHSVFDHPLSSNISINLVISKHNDSWVVNNNYECKSLGADSAACQYQVKLNNFMVESQLNIAPSLNGGSVTYCTDDNCSQSYYTFINPRYTAETLNRLYPNQ